MKYIVEVRVRGKGLWGWFMSPSPVKKEINYDKGDLYLTTEICKAIDKYMGQPNDK